MTARYTEQQIEEAAKTLLEAFPRQRVFAVHGDMGSGKTTLVSAICRVLGVKGTTGSPTFPIINEYRLPGGRAVYHIDLYRLDGAEEAVAAGVEEALYSGCYCFVEWPEMAPAIFPDDTVQVFVQVISATERMISAEAG